MLDLEIVNFLRWMIQMGVTQYCTYVKYGSFVKIGRFWLRLDARVQL